MNAWMPLMISTVCVCATVWAETRERRALTWLFKPMAATCFIWLAWLAGAPHSNYGNWLLLGLACCWLGDVLLIPDGKRSFLAGLTSFLLGHLFYGVAFLQLPGSTAAALLALPPVLALAYFAYDKFMLSAAREAALVEATTQAVTERAPAEPEIKVNTEKSIAVLPFVNMSDDKD